MAPYNYYIPQRLLLCPIHNMRTEYRGLRFSGNDRFTTSGTPVFVTDPIYLADIYNSNNDPIADYVRAYSVVVTDFGGDTSCPVCWSAPFLVLPTATHMDWDACAGQLRWPDGSVAIIGCDSASFVFLVVHEQMPSYVRQQCDAVVQSRNGLMMHLPDGTYELWLEQLSGYPQENMAGLYRNIVAERVDY